jgi:hypothetical protein
VLLLYAESERLLPAAGPGSARLRDIISPIMRQAATS